MFAAKIFSVVYNEYSWIEMKTNLEEIPTVSNIKGRKTTIRVGTVGMHGILKGEVSLYH